MGLEIKCFEDIVFENWRLICCLIGRSSKHDDNKNILYIFLYGWETLRTITCIIPYFAYALVWIRSFYNFHNDSTS